MALFHFIVFLLCFRIDRTHPLQQGTLAINVIFQFRLDLFHLRQLLHKFIQREWSGPADLTVVRESHQTEIILHLALQGCKLFIFAG